MTDEELLKLSFAELVDLGICPTCFDRAHNGALFGDNSSKIIYKDEEIECFLVSNPRARGHMCISAINHYHDLSEAPDELNNKMIAYAKRFMQIIKDVYNCERVYLCTMCDGKNNHYHIQLIPRYAFEKRGSANFVKPRGDFILEQDKIDKMRALINDNK